MENIIPIENLPNYLRKYKVSIQSSINQKSIGSVIYTTFGKLPSKESTPDLLSLNLTASIQPGHQSIDILYDLNETENMSEHFQFENTVGGSVAICGKVLDASKMLQYSYDNVTKQLVITISVNFVIHKETLLVLDIFLNPRHLA